MQSAAMDEFVSRVRASSDILSVASQYVSFTRKGGRYWACCPFHSEKTPSFTVDPAKGFYHCFGCGAGGNVFNLIAKLENVSYFEAIKLQAKRLNIALPNERPQSPFEMEIEREEKSLLDISEMAANFFHNCLMQTSYGEKGRQYLESRGIDEKTIEDFRLGFAPDAWDKLSRAFKRRGVDFKQLIEAGLALERKNGEGIYDRFRNRVMIPITDPNGHVIAFGGRILGDDKDSPKYLNSPETLIFNKRRVLFGLDRAAQAIMRKGFVIVVEGYMDAISLAASGVENVVATLGTAFTEDHIKMLKRYAKRIVFCYDNDAAGQKATIRALPSVTAAGAEASIIIVPDGKDPDEFIRKHGAEEFLALASTAMPMIDYRIQYIAERADLQTPRGRIAALREILESIATMHDTALRNEYGRKLSTVLGLDPMTVNNEWIKYSSGRATQSKKVVRLNTIRAEAGNDKIWRAWRVIIKTGWYAGDLLQHALSLVPKENFPKVHQEIITYLEKCLDEERHADDISAAEELSKEALSELSDCLTNSNAELTPDEIQSYMDSLKVLNVEQLSWQYRTAMTELDSLEPDSPEYAIKRNELHRLKRQLDHKRNQ